MFTTELKLKTKLAAQSEALNHAETGLELTGDPEVDIQKEIAAILATNTQPEAQPLEIDFGGQKLAFKDQKELSEKLGQLVTNYQNVAQERANLAAQIQAMQAAQTQKPAAEPKKDTNEEFNQRFAELIQKGDTLAALDYANNILYFDGKVPNASKTMAAIIQQSNQVSQDLAVLRFKDAHPELPRTAEVGTILEQTRQQFGYPFSPEGLESSLAMAKHLGRIEPQQTKTQTQTQTPKFETPTLSRKPGSTEPNPLVTHQLEEMSIDQLERLASRMRAQGIN